jgi:hypothetical protein
MKNIICTILSVAGQWMGWVSSIFSHQLTVPVATLEVFATIWINRKHEANNMMDEDYTTIDENNIILDENNNMIDG